MKPYEFIGFGAIVVTKPYEFTRFGAIDVTKPYEFIGFGAIDPPIGSGVDIEPPRSGFPADRHGPHPLAASLPPFGGRRTWQLPKRLGT